MAKNNKIINIKAWASVPNTTTGRPRVEFTRQNKEGKLVTKTRGDVADRRGRYTSRYSLQRLSLVAFRIATEEYPLTPFMCHGCLGWRLQVRHITQEPEPSDP